MLHILLIEDREADAKITLRELRKSGLEFDSSRVSSEAQLLRALHGPVDVILADYTLPGFDVRRALALSKQHLPDAPFLIVSGTIEEEVGVEMMRLGADDYLLKDRLGRLAPAILRTLDSARERQVRRSLETQYQALFTQAPVGLIQTSAAGQVVNANTTLLAMLGYPSLDMLKAIDPASLYADPVEVGNLRLRMVESGGFHGHEATWLRRDGSAVQVLISAIRMIDWRGQHESNVAVIQDLTALQAAEAQRQAVEDRLSAVLDDIPVVVFAIRPDGLISMAQGSGLQVLGLKREDLEGATADQLFRGIPELAGMFEAALRSEASAKTVHLPRTDRYVDIHLRPILSEQGFVINVIGVAADATERHAAEQASMENDAKSKFLANMSHELRTPLNSVLGFAQLLSANSVGSLSKKELRYISNIESSGRLILSLVNDVLDLSKVVAGQIDLQLEPVDIDGVLEACFVQVEVQAAAGRVTLRLSGVSGTVAFADRQRVHQVVTNLLSNAIKFTPEGGSVTVDRASDSTSVRVAVIDSGIGIPPDMLEFVFDEFTQIANSQAGATQGTGLGLPLSRRLSELMGGSLEVESTVGTGSKFTIFLPTEAADKRVLGRGPQVILQHPAAGEKAEGVPQTKPPRGGQHASNGTNHEATGGGDDRVYIEIPGVARVSWEQESESVLVEWRGWASSVEYVDLLEAGLRALKIHHGHRWIADGRSKRAIAKSDQEWVDWDWFPRALTAGLRRFAVVNPQSHVARLNSEEILSRVPVSKLETAYFETLDDARRWISLPTGVW